MTANRTDSHIHPSKVGIIGCGNIGTEIALFLETLPKYQVYYLNDDNEEAALRLSSKLAQTPHIGSLADLINHCDLIIEAASKEAVKILLMQMSQLYATNETVILSSGGLFENLTLFDALNHGQFHVPSGAIGGFDALGAIKDQISELSLTTTKPASSLNSDITPNEEILIYEGGIAEAIRLFPKNINVAASLYLITRFKHIKIRINASPFIHFNRHEILCKGDFGELYFKFDNLPSQNPKTSALTIDSLKYLLQTLVIRNIEMMS